ncbi:beta-mannanase [Sphaerisporangium album]|uniref:Beta-mannanase n=1 Tax=Sphaerisporangium album TaxID=509200 RepID=A0A367FNE0_9ACTN|nr:beta-mannanase [Sphaerisporangium album]
MVVALVVALGCLTGCSNPPPQGGTPNRPQLDASSEQADVPYDVRPLLEPREKYLGVAVEGAPRSLAPVDAFAARIGKRPNLLAFYAAWGDGYDAQGVRRAWAAGLLPMISWEPFKPSLAAIADGETDDYIEKFAADVRKVNIPVAISIGHEMNGFWYPWGTKQNKPADFVRAWRHVHDVFLHAGATNAIWVWSPNVVNPLRGVPLKPYYPGASYVDWVGMVGYYTRSGAHTFKTLYGPTMRAVRRFSRKPFIITETSSQPGPRRRTDIADLFAGVAASPDVIGFVWFNFTKRADWRLETDPGSVAEFRGRAADGVFGFDVGNP